MAGLDALLLILAAVQAARAKINQGISSLDPKPRNEAEQKSFETGDYFRERGGPGAGIASIRALDPRALRLLMEAKQSMPARLWDFLVRHPEEIQVRSNPNEWLSGGQGHRASVFMNETSPYAPVIELARRAYAPEVKHELGHTAQALSGQPRGVSKKFPGMRVTNEEIRKVYPQNLIAGEALPRILDEGGNAKITNPNLALQALEKWFPKQK